MLWLTTKLSRLFDKKERRYRTLPNDSIQLFQTSDSLGKSQANFQEFRYRAPEYYEPPPPPTPPKPIRHEPQSFYAAPEDDDGWEPWTPELLASLENAQPSRTARRNCVVCLEDQNYDDFPMQLITDSCTHIPNICMDCLQAYLRSEVNDKAWYDKGVRCPEEDCNGVLDSVDIQTYADRETFTRFAQRLDDQLLGTMETFFRCPARGCGSGQEHVSGQSQPIVTCVKCRRRFCFRHKVPWSEHETMSCAEFDVFLIDPAHFRSQFQLANEEAERERAAEKRRRRQQEENDRAFAQTLLEEEQRAEAARQAELERQRRDREEREERAAEERRWMEEQRQREMRAQEVRRRQAEEAANLSTIQRTTKRCPNCQWPIEKNHGCDHMTCIKCRWEFCFICAAPYHGSNGINTIGNKAHLRSCKYYA